MAHRLHGTLVSSRVDKEPGGVVGRSGGEEGGSPQSCLEKV